MAPGLFALFLICLLIGNAIDSDSEFQSGAIWGLVWLFLAPLLVIAILIAAIQL